MERYQKPIMMTEEYWANSQFSVVRHSGGMKFQGNEYIICDKDGRDIYECSARAVEEGRRYAIEPGEPCDLVIRDWLPLYRSVGRERFMEIVKSTDDLDEARKLAAQT